jgi:hypothetical protein
MAFRVASYWDLEGTFDAGPAFDRGCPPSALVDGKPRRQRSRLRPDDGSSTPPTRRPPRRGRARALVDALDDAPFASARSRRSRTRARRTRRSCTSTLQQEASRKLGMSRSDDAVAQRLYENGYITYMRTDSTTLSESALTAARDAGPRALRREYVPDEPRPTSARSRTRRRRTRRSARRRPLPHARRRPRADRRRVPLYELIWKRTVASQMKDAAGHGLGPHRRRRPTAGRRVGASGTHDHVPRLPQAAYVEGTTTTTERRDDDRARCPPLPRATRRRAPRSSRAGHETKPPARYTEATLVKALEERGSAARRRTPRSSARSSTAATSTRRARRWCRRSSRSRSSAARAALPAARRLRVHRAHGGRPRRDRRRPQGPRRPWLREFYFGSDGVGRPASARHRASATSTPRAQLPIGDRRRHRAARRPLRPVPRGPRRRGRPDRRAPTCPTTCRPTS